MTRKTVFRWGVAACALALAVTGTGVTTAVAAPAATPAGVKHGVAFLVDGVETSWSDADTACTHVA